MTARLPPQARTRRAQAVGVGGEPGRRSAPAAMRTICSWSLVISRAISSSMRHQDLLHVGDAARRCVGAPRGTHRGALVGEFAQHRRARTGLRRRETDEAEAPSAKPDTTRAATAFTAPGQRHHRMPRRPATGRAPGSDTAGVPASVISATWRPAASSATITPGLVLVVLVRREHASRIPCASSGRWLWRVSSARPRPRSEHGKRAQRDVMQVPEAASPPAHNDGVLGSGRSGKGGDGHGREIRLDAQRARTPGRAQGGGNIGARPTPAPARYAAAEALAAEHLSAHGLRASRAQRALPRRREVDLVLPRPQPRRLRRGAPAPQQPLRRRRREHHRSQASAAC